MKLTQVESNIQFLENRSGRPIVEGIEKKYRSSHSKEYLKSLIESLKCDPYIENHMIDSFTYDFAWPYQKLIAFIATRDRKKNMEKSNLAAIHKWRVIIIPHENVKNGKAINLISKALNE